MSSGQTVHVPVLVHEVLEQLVLVPGLVIVDATVGGGGHSRQILQQLTPGDRLIGIDRDPQMVARAAAVLANQDVILKHGNYAELPAVLDQLGIDKIDRILVDLGLSSDQLADPHRGFGFDTSGPLDMRFDPGSGTSAAELLNSASVAELAGIFRDFGEEPAAEKIASRIVQQRQQGSCPQTASELVAVVETVAGRPSPGRSHPATRIFQSLRISVNRELEQLQRFLGTVLPQRLRPGGRALIITFHSLEDRLVKQAFRDTDTWDNLTRKPIVATPSEVRWNPRSRSAKLRVAVLKESPR